MHTCKHASTQNDEENKAKKKPVSLSLKCIGIEFFNRYVIDLERLGLVVCALVGKQFISP